MVLGEPTHRPQDIPGKKQCSRHPAETEEGEQAQFDQQLDIHTIDYCLTKIWTDTSSFELGVGHVLDSHQWEDESHAAKQAQDDVRGRGCATTCNQHLNQLSGRQ